MRGDRFRVAVGHLGAEKTGGEEVVGPAVEGPHGDHMGKTSRRGVREQRGGDRRHAGGERHRGLGSLEGGEPLLESCDGGVPEPGVDRASIRRRGAASGQSLVGVASRFDTRKRVRRREIDRWRVHAEVAEVGAPGMNGEGVGVKRAHDEEHRGMRVRMPSGLSSVQ